MPNTTGTGDYNSDREGHVKHEYIVINAEQKPTEGIAIEGQNFKFNKEGYFKIKGDPALAQDIRQAAGKSATVTRVRVPDAADSGHKYLFGSWPEMPWKRKKQDEKEIETQQTTEENHEEEGQAVPEIERRAD